MGKEIKLSSLQEDFQKIGLEVEGITETRQVPRLRSAEMARRFTSRLAEEEHKKERKMEARGAIRRLDETRREFSRRVRRLGRLSEDRRLRLERFRRGRDSGIPATEQLLEELKSLRRMISEQDDSFTQGYRQSMLPTKRPIGAGYTEVSGEVARAFRNVATLADILAARLEDISTDLSEPEKKEVEDVIESLGEISEQAEKIAGEDPVEKKPAKVASEDEEEEPKPKEEPKKEPVGESRFLNHHLKRTLVSMVEDLTKVTDYFLKVSKR